MAGLRVSLVQQPLAWHDPPANRAHFHIKPGAQSGTLIEVVFSHATVKA